MSISVCNMFTWILKSLWLCRCSKFCCHGLIKIVVVSCCLDLNKSPSDTNAPIEKQKKNILYKSWTKNVKLMWALVQVLPIKHNNFCLTVMNRKLSNGIAYNVFWLGEVADFQHKCLIEKLNLNFALNCYRSTSPAILPNQC